MTDERTEGMMEQEPAKQPPSFSVASFIPTTIILIILGWGGLYLLVNYTTPNGGTRWLFFFANVLAFTGLALPIFAFLNKRFPSNPPASASVILRQAIWVGIYIPTLEWLQLGRVLTSFLAILLALGFILIEWLLRIRERSQWKP
jgi:hypothetical protein